MGILLTGVLVQLGILYNFLRYELQRSGLAKHILHEPVAETLNPICQVSNVCIYVFGL